MRNCNTAAIIALSLCILVFMPGCSNSDAKTFEDQKDTTRTVRAYKLKDDKNKLKKRFPGTVKPSKEAKISFRIGGPISNLDLETGQKVEKGEVIASIDKRDFILKIKSIKSKLNAAKARFNDAKLQFERYKSLFRENAAPKAKFDQIESGYLTAKFNKKALEKELEAAQNALEDTSLKAPFTGYIERVFAQKHETVAPGHPVASIIDILNKEVETFIPETLVSKIDKFSNFSFSLTAYPDKKFKASFKEIGQSATGSGKTYPLILKIESQSPLIRAGMSATTEFTIKNTENEKFFDIPLSALLSKDPDSSSVWKINKGKAEKKDVKIISLLNNTQARIKGDLQKGDLIVTSGSGFIHKNQKVEIIDSASSTNIGNEL
jgi:RND family efflux transporter MFP subunit